MHSNQGGNKAYGYVALVPSLHQQQKKIQNNIGHRVVRSRGSRVQIIEPIFKSFIDV